MLKGRFAAEAALDFKLAHTDSIYFYILQDLHIVGSVMIFLYLIGRRLDKINSLSIIDKREDIKEKRGHESSQIHPRISQGWRDPKKT